MSYSAEEQLKEISQKVKYGKVALFVGAGATVSAGGPSSKDLVEALKREFPKANQELTDLLELCQDILDTAPYDRNDLENFIKQKLITLQPSKEHKIMTNFDWKAIFTTNYDDLIEYSFRQAGKICYPIFSENFQYSPSDRSRIYLFKLMGSVSNLAEKEGTMVLSRADYNRAITKRRQYFESLIDFLKNGTMLFIGYSFSDRLVLDVLDELIEIYGYDRIPYSYALFKLVQMDEKKQNMFDKRKIMPVECSFENFFEFLEKHPEFQTERQVSKNVHIKVKGNTLEISPGDLRNYSEYFEVLTEEKVGEDPGDKENFFKGSNRNWGAFREGWDFKRDFYVSPDYRRKPEEKHQNLKDRIRKELERIEVKDNKVILIKGMAGVGKTMTLRRIAYDVYTTLGVPVLILNLGQVHFDYKTIESFIGKLQSEGEHILPIKPLIIIDDAGSSIRHVKLLKNYLTSIGRPVLIIAAERTGEWNLMWENFPFNIYEGNIYELSENLSDGEKTRIIEHFYNLGYIKDLGTSWDSIIDREFGNSYFATIYKLVDPSRKPLEEIIKDQYQELTELTQKAFKFICSFHQYNLPINLELLVRSLKCVYDDFFAQVINKDGAKVIFEEQDEEGNLLYRSHHAIIAQKTMEFFFNDREMQKQILLEILNEANLSNSIERKICETLLVTYIGPNAKDPNIFTYEQKKQIFETVCKHNYSRTLTHHWGILESDNQNYSEAEKLLLKALDMKKDEAESFRGESDQYILTSLGTLYSRMGMEYFREGKVGDAKDYFSKAEEYFQGGKYGEFPNAYAYHGHALMWLLRAKETSDNIERIECSAKALEIISAAKDNLNPDDLKQIYEIEEQVWLQIGNESNINSCLSTLRDSFNSADGYYLYAVFLWHEGNDKDNAVEKKEYLELALKKAQEGLQLFSSDENCLQVQSKLLKELYPSDLKTYFQSLRKWKSVALISNAWLLYELGRTAFILEYYDLSRDHFEELEKGVGAGHRFRSRTRYPILDENGKKREFQGKIVKMYSQKEGYLKCSDLRNLNYEIRFQPSASHFTPSVGDLVKFYIEFSYRGPFAVDVSKV